MTKNLQKAALKTGKEGSEKSPKTTRVICVRPQNTQSTRFS